MVIDMSCDGTRFPTMIDELFVGVLRKRGWKQLQAHLSSCAPCRGHYERVMEIEHSLQYRLPRCLRGDRLYRKPDVHEFTWNGAIAEQPFVLNSSVLARVVPQADD